jgi:two-component system, OmpR family, sensor histidine kinase KdpD
LRTPLAVMSGASSSLAESGECMTAAERRALATSVCEQAQDMSELVTKVLQMTRLESGAIALDRDWASLGEMAGSVLRRLASRLVHHRVIVDVAQDLPLLLVDGVLIEQALGNLIENAATHTPSGTVVRLSAEARGAEVIVTVEDYAKGISGDDADRLFDKFNRSPGGTRSGVGLGLAICRAIIGLHGGRAWAERLPAGGSAFRFSVPLHEVPVVSAEPAAIGR